MMFLLSGLLLPFLAVQLEFTKAFDNSFYTNVPANIESYLPGQLIRQEPETNFVPGVLTNYASASRIAYRSTGQVTNAVMETGIVFFPNTAAPEGGYNVAVWCHGSTGVGDDCAPSKWPNLFLNNTLFILDYLQQVNNLLGEGYVVVAPDYEGLGTPGLHTFAQAKALAYSVIDAARVAMGLASSVSSKYVVVGHSEGGQAAIAAGEYAATPYGNGIQLVGVAAYAPANNLAGSVERNAASSELSGILTYYGTGMRSINPHFQYKKFLAGFYLEIVPQIETTCVLDSFNLTFVPDPSPETLLNKHYNNSKTVNKFFNQSVIGMSHGAAPIIAIVGTNDTFFYQDWPLFTSQVCQSGNVAEFIVLPGVSHTGAVAAGWPDVKIWLSDRLAGGVAPNSCGVI